MQPDIILPSFGLNPAHFSISRTGSGYIHATYKLTGPASYILQRINKNVFKQPEIIASNIREASNYLKHHHPEYLFLSSIQTADGKEMAYDDEGFPWRLFPFIENSITVDEVAHADEAFSAATEFARLTNYLDGVSLELFSPTINQFHDLNWRYQQFEHALRNATSERMDEAAETVSKCITCKHLVDQYNKLINSGVLQLRITHNDTKINNILFDSVTRKAICVIDLDTLMPGYFIYDLGDMIRTFVSPVNEEEKDLSKIVFRKPIYDALASAYHEQMDEKLNETEKTLFPFAGMMMTYIMALRMLTDFLEGDVYYQITYPKQNLIRARNQIKLLDVLMDQSY